jgi:hypothetical protein
LSKRIALIGLAMLSVATAAEAGRMLRGRTAAAPPPAGPTYYFSDCQTGAHASCVAGNNANAGTSAASPKQDLTGFNYNALAAGTTLAFARGGVWNDFVVQLQNDNATASQPLVFDAYTPSWGGSAAPWMKHNSSYTYLFQFGAFGNTNNDGGYTIRNLKLDGLSHAGSRGFHFRNNVHDVLIEGVEMAYFAIAVESGNDSSPGISAITYRNNNIHHNFEMGMLGDYNGVTWEGNLFSRNGTGTVFDHAIYMSGEGRDVIVRGNTFANNSVDGSDVCTGGNFTIHGVWDNVLVEDNIFTQTASTGSCYGISITDGYNTAEAFTNVIVRRNDLTNLGGPIVLRAAPSALVDANKIRSDGTSYTLGIAITAPGNAAGVTDNAGNNPTLTNNIICAQTAATGGQILVTVSGGTETGTVIRTGANALTGACAP